MSVRDAALQCEAFNELYDVYTHRDKVAQAWKESGGRVIGCLGADVPDELLIAAGLLPIHTYADPDRELTYTDTYLEFSFDPVARATFEKIVDGTYFDLFDHLAISHTGDAELRMWLYLREIHRVERDMKVPPVEFIDWLMHLRALYQTINEKTIRRFRATVEAWVGRQLFDEDIAEAAKICNRDRAALRAMGELRHGDEVRINGSEALVIIGSALFMERARHTELVEQVVEAAKTWPVLTGPRIFVTGSDQQNTDLYGLVEDAGGVVIGEDHDWGDRYYDRDYNLSLPPDKAIVDRYWLRQISSKKSSVADRVKELDDAVAADKAQGVIFFMNIYEDSGSWDYPSQKKSLDASGIANAYFARQAYPIDTSGELASAIAEFVKGMEG